MSIIRTLGPVGFNPRGEYNSEVQYERLDVVLYNGVSYAAKQTVTGQLPTNTTYWDALGVSGADMSDYYTKSEVDGELEDKYEKPETGIPKTDLASAVQTSLGKADSALQSSDLTNYVTNTDYANNSTAGVFKTSANYATYVNPNNEILSAETKNYADYTNGSNSMFISKGTLENVIDGKDLTTKAYVDGLVGDISSTLDTINGEVI